MSQTFADHALAMRAAGWAVLPANGKAPLVGNFNAMSKAPSSYTIERWAKRFPAKDIVYVPGLCETGRGRGVIVVDADTAEAIGQAREIFGDTAAKVRTRKGEHFVFASGGFDPKLASLRNCGEGFAIDLRHGQGGAGIVAAPPSPFEKDRSSRYAWDGCDASIISDLTLFPKHRYIAFLERHPPKTRPDPKPDARTGFRCDSRGLGLNDYLMSQAWALGDCDTHQERLAAASELADQFNEELPRRGLEMLDGAEIERRVSQIVKDLEAGRIERFHGMRAASTTDADEIRAICEFSSSGDSAIALLMLLRAEHGARCKRGETFKLMIHAMVETHVLGDWAAHRYRKARDILLELELIREVSPAGPRCPAEYTLVDRTLTPSISRGSAC